MIEFDEETIERYAEEEHKPMIRMFSVCCKVKDMHSEISKAYKEYEANKEINKK